MDLDAAYALHPQVAVRPERFGALLYHFGTRRLSFLKDPKLYAAVRDMSAHTTAREACGPDAERFEPALRRLVETGMLVAA